MANSPHLPTDQRTAPVASSVRSARSFGAEIPPIPPPPRGTPLPSNVQAAATVAAADAQLADSDLLLELDRAFERRRIADARILAITSEVVHRSRSTLGPDSLASRLGVTSAALLIASIGRISAAEAHRFCRVASETNSTVSFLGEELAPAYALVAEAIRLGRIPLDSAHAIVTALAAAAPRANGDDALAAEDALVDFARHNPADAVRTLAIAWRDALDVDGIEPREDLLVRRRSLRRTIQADGMKRYLLLLDPLSSAYLDAVIDAAIGRALRRPTFTDAATSPTSDLPSGPASEPGEQIPETRTIGQIAADAMVDLARHALGCSNTGNPLTSTTVVVRMSLESLLSGIGEARIDGIEQPISATTARIVAADAQIIPMVLGTAGEVLDVGRTARLFTKAQRLALAERDGGCAAPGCCRPPSYTEAHHIEWWSLLGPTNMRNGVLLCSKHHHGVHRDGWGIEVRNNVPWFIPPSSIDASRTPRRGGRLQSPQLAPLQSTSPHQPAERAA